METIQQCPLCNSQGEFLMDELKPQKKYLLDTLLLRELNKIIKKLNDEVDMLTKQKLYLQSKCREKGKDDKKTM